MFRSSNRKYPYCFFFWIIAQTYPPYTYTRGPRKDEEKKGEEKKAKKAKKSKEAKKTKKVKKAKKVKESEKAKEQNE